MGTRRNGVPIPHWLLSSPVVSEASLTKLDSAMDEGAGSAPS